MNSDGTGPNPIPDQFQDQNQSTATPKQQVVERVRAAQNVLVTVRANPTVDELSATIGLTLMLNKLGKHATAVFSGQVPSTLEFLRPEETIEQNTDSLRDFIVSLDKSKADKLRYKVEENVVKIFITPYRTSITEKDLEFTQGDFNVDVVLALGVSVREELDQAVTAHGRILHDATVVTLTAGQHESTLGAINWQEAGASSLCEMLVSISEAFQGGLIDPQMATAFLTGIVSETQRFSNPKTSPKVMTMAAQLMAAGANQQLIANELEKAVEVDVQAPVVPDAAEPGSPAQIEVGADGSLSIAHDSPDAAGDDKAGPAEAAPPNIDDLFDEAALKQVESTPTPPAPMPTEPENQGSFLPPADPGDALFDPLMPAPGQEPAEVPLPQLGESQPAMPPAGPPAVPQLPQLPMFQPDPPRNEPGFQSPPIVVHPAGGEQIHIDEEGNLQQRKAEAPKHNVIQPFDHDASGQPQPPEEAPSKLPPMPELPPDEAPDILPDNTTLEQLEETVHSPHLEVDETLDPVEAARNAVQDARSNTTFDPAHNPRDDNNAMPFAGEPPAGDDHSQLPPVPGLPLPDDPQGPPPPPVPPPLQLPQ